MFTISPLYNSQVEELASLKGFKPLIIDSALLASRGVAAPVSEELDAVLIAASHSFASLFNAGRLTADPQINEAMLPDSSKLEVHNYTGLCPTNVLEISPSAGACSIGCQYCLVTDGDHRKPITVWRNYPALLERFLEEHQQESRFYYFSPKSEAFSEPHLECGVAHEILRVFRRHFSRYPQSAARIFIASKAAPRHLQFTHAGDAIIDLLSELRGKAQYAGSIGVMPENLRKVLEPNAASVDERLEAIRMCNHAGVHAKTVLTQPLILPYLTDAALQGYFDLLCAAGVQNVKPEFLTTDLSNLVAVAQFVNHFNPELLGPFFAPYLAPGNETHIKQRRRLAPDRSTCVKALLRLVEKATAFGITVGLCNWVGKELSTVNPAMQNLTAGSHQAGYRCLGYQTSVLS